MDHVQSIKYVPSCGGCGGVIMKRTAKECPACGAKFVKPGAKLRELTGYIKSNHRILMDELNCRGNYCGLDGLTESEMYALRELISEAREKVLVAINEAMKKHRT